MNKRVGEADGDNVGQATAMTLSTIAYYDQQVPEMLKKHAPDWEIEWLPGEDKNGNFAYVAYNSSVDQYAVVIRGSVLAFSWSAFDDWFEQDFNIMPPQVAWNYSGTGAMISPGASDGFNDLTTMVGSHQGVEMTLLSFLNEFPVKTRTPILITGHSLGGGLCTVIAPWLAYQNEQNKTSVNISVLTFAAPAIGNKAFAEAYDQMFSGVSWRFHNVIDIVPMCAAGIKNMGNLYYPGPEASTIEVNYLEGTTTLKHVFEDISELVKGLYHQTNSNGGAVGLNQDRDLCPTTVGLSDLEAWFEQAGCQHSTCKYLTYTGADPFTCSGT